LRFDPGEFLRVPIAVLVGDQDLTSESLRRNEDVDRQQGVTRLERARNWATAMRTAAELNGIDPRVSFQQVAGIHHSFRQFMLEGQLGDRVFRALFGRPSTFKPARDEGAGSGEQRRGARGSCTDAGLAPAATEPLVCVGSR
jgi:hypothetical protein